MKCSQTTGTVHVFIFNIATQLDLHVYVYLYTFIYAVDVYRDDEYSIIYMTKFVSELTPVEVSRWFYSTTIVSNPRLITLRYCPRNIRWLTRKRNSRNHEFFLI